MPGINDITHAKKDLSLIQHVIKFVIPDRFFMQIILSLLLIFGIWNITYSSLTKRKINTFIADDPEYQIDKAIGNWMKKTGKSLDEEADDDFSIFWNYASNHCAMFLTWAIMHDYCGDLHLSEEPESVEKVKKGK